MQPESHWQQSYSQPSSTFLQSATSKEAVTEVVDVVDEDMGIKAGDKAYKEEEGTHAPHLQTTLHVEEVAASPLSPRNQCQDCHLLAQGLQMCPTPTQIKWYANMNACFSCGFKVEDGHTSKTSFAIWRHANHQEGYDRSNAQQYIAVGYNACTKAMHKTQYPNF
jgi:hypothetical protein